MERVADNNSGFHHHHGAGPRQQGGAANAYVVQKIIGQGSFGVVFHAKTQDTGEDVAIKRVLYDRRLHSRELMLMRDILSDARSTAKDDGQGGSTSTTGDTTAAQRPQSPLSPSSLPSPISPFTSFRTGTPKRRVTPVVLLRKHPNIVQLRNYYFSSDPSTGERFLHLVMSYLPSDAQLLKRTYFKSLGEATAHDGSRIALPSENEEDVEEKGNSATALFPVIYTKAFLFQLCRALAFLHARDVCHRDVKPANILVDPVTARLQLCDFGSAKQIRDRANEKNVSYICSRYYRAPELLFGALHYGTEVDMWSVGCIAAEFLRSGGSPLFKGSTTVDQMAEIFKVLGAPSAVEMRAMNPQCAVAMQFTHREQYGTSGRATSQRCGDAERQSATEKEQHRAGLHHLDEDEPNDASPPACADFLRRPAVTPTLDREYYHCYDVLRVEAMQWERVLHCSVPDEAVDFVSKLLCYVPEKRMTAAAALEHPFFDDLFSSPPQSLETTNASDEGGECTKATLPRLPNGRTLPVEMFMLTGLETQLYSSEFQQRMNKEVQRISSAAAVDAGSSFP